MSMFGLNLHFFLNHIKLFHLTLFFTSFHSIPTSGEGYQQPRARPSSRSKGSRFQVLQTTNNLIARPLSGYPVYGNELRLFWAMAFHQNVAHLT